MQFNAVDIKDERFIHLYFRRIQFFVAIDIRKNASNIDHTQATSIINVSLCRKNFNEKQLTLDLDNTNLKEG